MTPTVVIAAGGTGGHIYPGLAVAGAIRDLAPAASITFVGTPRGLEGRLIPEAGWPLRLVDMTPFVGWRKPTVPLALGITAWLTFQALINIAVVVSLIPMTGMPLPFLSKGGTSLVVVLAAVGILLSISRETVTRGADAHEDPHRSRGHRRPHLPRPGRRDPAADATA